MRGPGRGDALKPKAIRKAADIVTANASAILFTNG